MQWMVSLIHPLIVEPTYDQPLTPTALCQGRNRSTSYLETVPSTEQQSPTKLYRFKKILIPSMTNHRLSIEQKFQLEAAFRDIDACDDIGKLREITKAIITAQENEKAFAREAISRMRQEIEVQASSSFGFNRAAGQ